MEYYDSKMEMAAELFRIRLSFDRFITPIVSAVELTEGTAALLHIISSCSAPTVKTVVEELELNQGNASTMCKRLESLGYITRKKKKEDERSVTLEVTDKGREVLHFIDNSIDKFLSEHMSGDDIQAVQKASAVLSEGFAKIANYRKGVNDAKA